MGNPLAGNRNAERLEGYYAFAYGRALGISMVTFAIALSIGVSVTTAISSLVAASNLSPVEIWSVLIAATVIIVIGSFSQAHVSSAKYLRRDPHSEHSKYLAAWIAAVVIGVIISIMAVTFINSSIEPLVLLFSFGGAFWILYISVEMMFNERYTEVAAGAVALWVIFFIGVFESQVNALLSNGSLALFVSSVSLVAIFGVTGLTLILNADRSLVGEVDAYMRSGSRGLRKARR